MTQVHLSLKLLVTPLQKGSVHFDLLEEALGGGVIVYLCSLRWYFSLALLTLA